MLLIPGCLRIGHQIHWRKANAKVVPDCHISQGCSTKQIKNTASTKHQRIHNQVVGCLSPQQHKADERSNHCHSNIQNSGTLCCHRQVSHNSKRHNIRHSPIPALAVRCSRVNYRYISPELIVMIKTKRHSNISGFFMPPCVLFLNGLFCSFSCPAGSIKMKAMPITRQSIERLSPINGE